MKRLNFKELRVETSIDEFEAVDVRKAIGNALYKLADSIPMSDLSRKIYHSEGMIEIEDQDCAEMVKTIEPLFRVLLINAVKDNIEDVTDKSKENVKC